MGKWDIVIKDEFDGHLVVVDVCQSNFETDIGGADSPASE